MQQLTAGGMDANMAEAATRCLMAGFAAQNDAVRASYVSRDEAARSALQHESIRATVEHTALLCYHTCFLHYFALFGGLGLNR